MQALIAAALVAAAAASGIGPALSGARNVALPAARAGRGYGYGAASRGYADEYTEARPYHYQYAVDDPNYGPMFNKEEQSDGAGNVQGYYAVNLPDGRTQHVKYVADGYSGFNAEVTYDGYANHPEVARGYGSGRGVAGVVGHTGAGHVVASGGAGLFGRRAGGYGAGAGLVGHRVGGYGTGAGLVGRRVGGYGAGAGLVGRRVGGYGTGAGLVGRRVGGYGAGAGLVGHRAGGYGAGAGLVGRRAGGYGAGAGLVGRRAGGYGAGVGLVNAGAGLGRGTSLAYGH